MSSSSKCLTRRWHQRPAHFIFPLITPDHFGTKPTIQTRPLSKLWSPIGELRSYGRKKNLLDSVARCHYCKVINSPGDSISGPTPPSWGRFFMPRPTSAFSPYAANAKPRAFGQKRGYRCLLFMDLSFCELKRWNPAVQRSA